MCTTTLEAACRSPLGSYRKLSAFVRRLTASVVRATIVAAALACPFLNLENREEDSEAVLATFLTSVQYDGCARAFYIF